MRFFVCHRDKRPRAMAFNHPAGGSVAKAGRSSPASLGVKVQRCSLFFPLSWSTSQLYLNVSASDLAEGALDLLWRQHCKGVQVEASG